MTTPLDTPPVATGAKQKNGLGLAALIVGIVAFVFGIIPLLSFLAWLPALVAIGLGIAGLVVKNKKRLTAWIGLALGVLAIIVGIIVSVASVAAVATGVGEAIASASSAPLPEATTPAESAPTESAPAQSSNTVKLQYEVTGDGAASNITYSTFASGSSGTEQANDAGLPFTKELDLERGGAFDYSIFSLVALGSADTTTISCKITYDGVVLSEQTSTGAYSAVTCTGSPE
ncbi:DUF308 domain-containing protein [Microbacteriaceae bacterium VKM Ac-2855]|nr:DUF308 domain-containing protein [Microbacteriaceae bacterium VKM Ac-2855]